MVGLLLGQVEHGQAGQRLDARDGRGDALRGGAAEHEPHVPLMFAAVVVGDFRQAVEDGRHGVEAFFRHGQGGQGEGAAQAVDVEHGAEAGEGAVVQQGLHAGAQGGGVAVQFLGQRLPRAGHQRQAQLQAVDQAAVEVIHGRGPGPARSARRIACRRGC